MKGEVGILITVLILFTANYAVHGQRKASESISSDIFLDLRDGQQYVLLKLDSLWWFNQNLNFATEESDCFRDTEEYCKKRGRLYSFKEAQTACPDGWRLPSIEEFDDLLSALMLEKSQELVTIQDTSKIAIPFNFQCSGFKHKRKYKSRISLNFWLTDYDVGYHVHMYGHKKPKSMLLFRHNHEKHNPILEKRKFAVRCVSDEGN